MTPERWQEVKGVLDAVLERDLAERAACLEEACHGDLTLRREVESLLASAERGEALERPPLESLDDVGELIASPGVAEAGAPGAEGGEPRTIGPYRILRELGRGGMGFVYLGERHDGQYRKRVAIKVVRGGLESEEIVGRFRNERQILASVEHPHIARLLDGGSTEDGRPYFVMEFVDGQPIDEYCDSRGLSVAGRLELFRQVCSAVTCAHQNLLVHRDLKPGNVLVTPEGVPKLLDFGIAKLLDPELRASAVETGSFQRYLMTPDYASPEQVRGEPITTASDVYSLGVVLYELLTGHRPYRVKSRTLNEIFRAVSEEEPTRASAVIALVEERPGPGGPVRITPETVSRVREGTPARLRRRLRGDLDNVLLMALGKEPARRYGSVDQLSEDLRRVLGGFPVTARKPTLAYRGFKFVRRHAAGLAAAAVSLILLLGFSVIAVRERDRAEKEAARAKAVSGFLLDTLRRADPAKGVRRTVTVVEALAEAAKQVDSSFPGEPEIQAQLQYIIGDTYSSLGLYEEAVPPLRASLDGYARVFGDQAVELVAPLEMLAFVRSEQGEEDEAERLHERALRISRRGLGREGWVTANVLSNLAGVHSRKGHHEAAEGLGREALAIQEKAGGPEDPSLVAPLNNLAAVYVARGQEARAAPLLRRSLPIAEKAWGPTDPTVARILASLGTIETGLRRYGEAERLLLRARGIEERALGPDHPSIAVISAQLGALYVRQGWYAEAERLLESSLPAVEKAHGADHRRVAAILGNLGRLHMERGRYEEAERVLRRCLESGERRGEWSTTVADALNNLAELHGRTGRLAEGERLCRRGLQIRDQIRGDGPPGPDDAAGLETLAMLLAGQGQHASAEPLYEQALGIYEASLGPDHPDTAKVRQSLKELRQRKR